MYTKTHPYFLEESEVTLARNEVRALKARVEDLLFEFEHSEEYRACSKGYLQTPRLILEDFITETRLPLEALDTEFLFHEIFVVVPSRMIGLVKDDAHQILREQLSFWAFTLAHWQLPHAEDCIQALDDSALQKLIKIISLGDSKQGTRARHHAQLHGAPLEQELAYQFNMPWDQDVYPLNQHIPF